MPACNVVNGRMQTLHSNAPLEVDREEPVIPTGDHVNGNIGPSFEPAGLAEHRVRLRSFISFALLDNRWRHVVQEVGGHVELRAITPALRGRLSCGRRPGVSPPFPRRLAGNGYHRVDENQHTYGDAGAHDRRRKTGEGLRDEDCRTSRDNLDHPVCVRGQTETLIVSRQVDRDRVMPGPFEQRHYTMPVPSNTTSTRNENKVSHFASR